MIWPKRVKWHSLVINEGKVAQFDDWTEESEVAQFGDCRG